MQVIIDPTLSYFREATLGVRQYGFETGRFELVDRWLGHERLDLPALVKRDRVHGIVAALHRPALELKFSQLSIPVVNVSNTMMEPRLTVVTQDDEAVGRLAAEHLIASGTRRFAVVGQHLGRYSEERLAGFRQGVMRFGGDIQLLRLPPLYGRSEYVRIRRWLEKVGRPLAVFAVLDFYGFMVVRAAHELGWHVPDDIAVLGAGDDDFHVGFERIPLSSIRLPARRIGYEAGAAIDRLITEQKFRLETARLSPLGINIRPSTDTIFVSDPLVVKALRFIRSQATRSPYVDEVARHAGAAKTTLQLRFRKALGHTLLEEIQRVRIHHAKELLRSTDLRLEGVAERCGFANSQRFSVLFRRYTGVAPGQFRKQAR